MATYLVGDAVVVGVRVALVAHLVVVGVGLEEEKMTHDETFILLLDWHDTVKSKNLGQS